MSIPEGYVLVPVEPTDTMKDVALKWGTKKTEWEEILAAAPSVELPAYDEVKERELFEAEFDKPDTAKFDGEEYRYSGQADRTEMVLFLEFFGAWSGWKKCAKSRARSAE